MAKSHFHTLRAHYVSCSLYFLIGSQVLALPNARENNHLEYNQLSVSTSLPRYAIPNAPGFQIEFNQPGEALDFNDSINVLLLAEIEILVTSEANTTHLTDSRTLGPYAFNTVELTITLGPTTSQRDAAVLVAGLLEWGTDSSFTEVVEIELIDQQGTSTASGRLIQAKPKIKPIQTLHQTNITHLLHTSDAFLWPLPSVPDSFIRFTPKGDSLSRRATLRVLEAADAGLIYLFHQAPVGIDPPLRTPQSWTKGAVSYTITPAREMTVIAAGLFNLGLINWVTHNEPAEAELVFIRRVGGAGGEMRTLGYGQVERADTADA